MSQLVLHLFGSPSMEVDGKPVEVDTRKATALLAYLVVNGETHQRDALAALLWPDYDQTSARAALRRTLSTLNRGLEGEDGNPFLEIARESVGVNRNADIWSDIGAFRSQLAGLSTHKHPANEICPTCLSVLKTAAELYHDPFMAGFNLRDSPNFEEWQFFQEETLRRELSSALEKLVVGLFASGQVEEAIQYARRWLAQDSLLEEAHRQLMILYSLSDQRNAALRQYRECVRILDQELGVTPLEETTRLYQSILNREALPEQERRFHYIEQTPPGDLPEQQRAVRTSAALDEALTAGFEAPVNASEYVAPERPLIGRAEEQARITEMYKAIHIDGRLVTIEGEAGIGKSRLAEEFLIEARAKGAAILQARCYSGEANLAYAPFIEGISAVLHQPGAAARLTALSAGVLSEASRLLPEIDTPAQGTSSQPTSLRDGAQARFFDALRQVIHTLLTGPVPGVLFLDDLQWADSASLDLLNYLARRLKGTRLLILMIWRSEPGENLHVLERLTGELTRTGQAIRIPLKRLTLTDVIEMVRTYPCGNWKEPEKIGQRLFEESEGLPFVAIEYLAMLTQRTESSSADHWDMPTSVRDLFHSRLEEFDAATQQLLSTAAVIGRSFDYDTLHEVSGRSEIETVDGLDRLLVGGIVIEQSRPGWSGTEKIRYDFTQEKLRALIYQETSLARRHLLHRRIAETLARVPGSRVENPGLVAYHFEQAGMARQSAEYHLLAGERARQLFANVEALAHFKSALAAGHPDAAGLHEAIGDLYTLRGEYSAAIISYQTAAALCTPGCIANLEHKLGNVHHRLGEWTLAESHYRASLEAAGLEAETPAGESFSAGAEQNRMVESAFHVHLYADRSLAAHARGDPQSAQALAIQALELAEGSGDAYALAQAQNVLGVLARARGDLTTAISALEASLRAAETLADPLPRIAALNNLSLVHGEANNNEEAIRLVRQALDLCQRRGDRHREAALHNNLADLLHRSGREDEAMEQLKQAVVIFAEIGAQPEGPLAGENASVEIWKLTEW